MKMPWQIQFENLLEKQFQDIKKRNRRFSLRNFAKMAKISPTLMSFILNRTTDWSLSLERAIESLENLNIDKNKIDHFKVLTSSKLNESALDIELPDQSILLTDAAYLPVLLSHGLQTRPDLATLAKKLKVSEDQVRTIIENLIKMGHLKVIDNKVIIPPQSDRIKTQDGPSSEVIRQHHAANIDMIRESLMNDPANSRDVTSLTLTGDASQIEEVKKEIRQFYQRIHAIMNHSENKNEIFKFVVGFMPLNIQEHNEGL